MGDLETYSIIVFIVRVKGKFVYYLLDFICSYFFSVYKYVIFFTRLTYKIIFVIVHMVYTCIDFFTALTSSFINMPPSP